MSQTLAGPASGKQVTELKTVIFLGSIYSWEIGKEKEWGRGRADERGSFHSPLYGPFSFFFFFPQIGLQIGNYCSR